MLRKNRKALRREDFPVVEDFFPLTEKVESPSINTK